MSDYSIGEDCMWHHLPATVCMGPDDTGNYIVSVIEDNQQMFRIGNETNMSLNERQGTVESALSLHQEGSTNIYDEEFLYILYDKGFLRKPNHKEHKKVNPLNFDNFYNNTPNGMESDYNWLVENNYIIPE